MHATHIGIKISIPITAIGIPISKAVPIGLRFCWMPNDQNTELELCTLLARQQANLVGIYWLYSQKNEAHNSYVYMASKLDTSVVFLPEAENFSTAAAWTAWNGSPL